MIKVEVRKNVLSVTGHADYAEKGKDIVCAAVTALSQTLIKSIEDLTDDKIKYEIEQGSMIVEYENLSEQGKLLIDSFFIGICQISEEFPENVKII